MLGTYFYHEILRKTVIGFGTLFNNINIRHTDASGTNVSTMKVPLAYGPMQKFLARIQQQPELEREIAITLPRLSFEMQGLQYDQLVRLESHKLFYPRVVELQRKFICQFHIMFHLNLASCLN